MTEATRIYRISQYTETYNGMGMGGDEGYYTHHYAKTCPDEDFKVKYCGGNAVEPVLYAEISGAGYVRGKDGSYHPIYSVVHNTFQEVVDLHGTEVLKNTFSKN